MAFARHRPQLRLTPEERSRLERMRRSRREEKRRTVRASILLNAADGMSDQANAAATGVNRNTVVLKKPGIQALAVTTPDRPPVPGQHPRHLRHHPYKRLGTVSLLAGLDRHTGRVTEIVSDTHKSLDCIAFLTPLDAVYPPAQTLRLILDNHSAHTSKQTQRYLAEKPQRFQFVFVPKHGAWLNLVENLFSKMARSMLREIRVATKQELIDRIHLYFQEVNAAPVVFRWKYKMDEVVIA